MVKAESIASALLPALLLHSCMPALNPTPEVHGHRGCRGLLPENTVPAFLRAAELGVDYLELDVVISVDSQVIVSHEPWMSHRICTDPEGQPITAENERTFNVYRMTAAEIRTFDCGGIAHPDFPDQEQRRAHKPSLREVVEAVEEAALLGGGNPGYNIEIKSEPAHYGTFQPLPAEFVRLVLASIDSLGIADRTIVQSFDPAVLQALHVTRPDITLALLVENADGMGANLQRLGFDPAIYSPHFSQVDADLVARLRERGIQVVTWTVNKPEDILRMLDLRVDGIISDYPDRVLKLIEEHGG